MKNAGDGIENLYPDDNAAAAKGSIQQKGGVGKGRMLQWCPAHLTPLQLITYGSFIATVEVYSHGVSNLSGCQPGTFATGAWMNWPRATRGKPPRKVGALLPR